MNAQLTLTNKFEQLDYNILVECMDNRILKNGKQYHVNGTQIFVTDLFYCYSVFNKYGNKLFEDKNELEKYLVSLSPDFIYNKLSELAIYIKNNNNNNVLDIMITSCKNRDSFMRF